MCTDGRVANTTACKTVVERPSGVRVPLCTQNSPVAQSGERHSYIVEEVGS